MKKIILLVITLFSFNMVTFAAFPITENSTTEILSTINNADLVEPNSELPISGGTPVFGILSFLFSMLAIVLFVAAVSAEAPLLVVGSLILSILSIVFGGLGFNKSLKGFAITGFVFGCIETLVWIIALIAGTVVAASSVSNSYYYY